MSDLSIWWNGGDWVIAESAEDATEVWEEFTGEAWEQYHMDGEEWEPYSRETWNVYFEDEPQKQNIPPGGEVHFDPDGDRCFGDWYVSASQDAWIRHFGRHWFCSENW